MKVMNPFIGIGMCILLSFTSCTTEDVTPLVSIEASANSLDISEGNVRIIATLNGAVNKDVTVNLNFAGTAIAGVDYTFSDSKIVILANNLTGNITLQGINTGDTTLKTIQVSLGEASGAIVTQPLSVVLELVNCLNDRDGDGISDCEDECPNEPGPIENGGCPWQGLIINEVLYDPAAGAAGDANNDGVRNPLADEFVEIFNSNFDLDISGYTLSDAAMVRHTFPQGTVVPSKGIVVVFGGGNPTGDFGGAIVQTASEGQLNLNNAGDVLTLKNAQDSVLAVFDINGLDGNPDEAYTRNPDIQGDFVKHSSIPAASGALFSPGKKVDGRNF